MTKEKRKRNLVTTFEHIERFHRRRSTFVFHMIFSLVFQVAMWVNWYFSYAIRGYGFDVEYIMDRVIISLVLVIFLAGHFALMRISESKDRMVVRLLEQVDQDANDEDEIEVEFHEPDQLAYQDAADAALKRKGKCI